MLSKRASISDVNATENCAFVIYNIYHYFSVPFSLNQVSPLCLLTNVRAGAKRASNCSLLYFSTLHGQLVLTDRKRWTLHSCSLHSVRITINTGSFHFPTLFGNKISPVMHVKLGKVLAVWSTRKAVTSKVANTLEKAYLELKSLVEVSLKRCKQTKEIGITSQVMHLYRTKNGSLTGIRGCQSRLRVWRGLWYTQVEIH